ncbi:MAG: polymerase subunit sigma-24 [Planctomycetaceae bacterium]|nr:polymerase subunit sigma-24 [Planctomycetaceae bacterium]
MEHATISSSLNQPNLDCDPAILAQPETAERLWFAGLVESHGSAVLALLRRLCRNQHDADDVFQETAVRVWRFRKSQRPVNPRTWLMTVAYRAFLDHRVRGLRQFPHCAGIDDAAVQDMAVSLGPPPGNRLDLEEAIVKLNTATAELPDSEREVVALHYSGGLSLSETASAMNISQGTVKSRLNSALKRLRSQLQ